jgi:ketosteroid isomerase-like protein
MLAIVAMAGATVNAQTPRPQAFIEVLLQTFVEAQRSFDVKQLDDILAPDYIEISPAGEVDRRAQVIGFYAPDKKVADAPPAALDEVSTRVFGESAVTIARLTYQMKARDGAVMARAMRCVFVTRIVDRKWKLVSAQYTPIRQ